MGPRQKRYRWLNTLPLVGKPQASHLPRPPGIRYEDSDPSNFTTVPINKDAGVLDLLSRPKKDRKVPPEHEKPPATHEAIQEPQPIPEPEPLAEPQQPTEEPTINSQPAGVITMTTQPAEADASLLRVVASDPEPSSSTETFAVTATAGEKPIRYKIVRIEHDRPFKPMAYEETVGCRIGTHRVERDMTENQLAVETVKILKTALKPVDGARVRNWEMNKETVPAEYLDALVHVLITENDNIANKEKAIKEFYQAYERSKLAAKKDRVDFGDYLFQLRQSIGTDGIAERTLAESINKAPRISIDEPLASIDKHLILKIQANEHKPSKGLALAILKALSQKQEIPYSNIEDILKTLDRTGKTTFASNVRSRVQHGGFSVVDSSVELQDLRIEILAILGNPSIAQIARTTQTSDTQIGRLLGTTQTYLPDMTTEVMETYITAITKNAGKFGVKGADKEKLKEKLEELKYLIHDLRGTSLERPKKPEPAPATPVTAPIISAAPAPQPPASSTPIPKPAPAKAAPAAAAEAAPAAAEADPKPAAGGTTAAEAAPAGETPAEAAADETKKDEAKKPAAAPAIWTTLDSAGADAAIKKINHLVSSYKQNGAVEHVNYQLQEMRAVLKQLLVAKDPVVTFRGMSETLTQYKPGDITLVMEGSKSAGDYSAIPPEPFPLSACEDIITSFKGAFCGRKIRLTPAPAQPEPMNNALNEAFTKGSAHLLELIKSKRQHLAQQLQQQL